MFLNRLKLLLNYFRFFFIALLKFFWIAVRKLQIVVDPSNILILIWSSSITPNVEDIWMNHKEMVIFIFCHDAHVLNPAFRSKKASLQLAFCFNLLPVEIGRLRLLPWAFPFSHKYIELSPSSQIHPAFASFAIFAPLHFTCKCIDDYKSKLIFFGLYGDFSECHGEVDPLTSGFGMLEINMANTSIIF